jgi:phosphatidylserine/phosphatidylglycerophosphate/cardiolipin synthase-like enzyme
MRHVLPCLLLPLLAGCLPALTPDHPRAANPPAAVEDDIAVYFSPGGGAMAAIVDQINHARTSIDVAAYVLTARQIIDPLAAAHRRGVRVRVLLDKKHIGGVYSAALARLGDLPVWRDAQHKEAHNKVILIDGQTIITGSFNFTDPAEDTNAENLLILHDKPNLYAAYQSDFESHLAHSDAPKHP